MTKQEWKLLLAILAIFVAGGIIRECRKAPLAVHPPISEPATLPTPPTK